MKFELKLNSISLNPVKTKKAMMPYIRRALDIVEEKLIDAIREEIDLVTGSPKEWRKKLKAHIKHIKDEVTDDVVRYFVGPGYPDDPENASWMRAMVIAFGNAPPIYAGPYGTEVWNNDLDDRTDSKVPSDVPIPIPDKWYHDGRMYIENAIKTMRKRFLDIVIDELSDMPATVFSKNIKIKKK